MFCWVLSKLVQPAVTSIGSLNSQDMISFMITTGCNSQNMIRILRHSGNDFSSKRLCERFCMEILCDVYV